MSKEVEGVVLKSVVQDLSECHFCGGVVFSSREQVLWFSQMNLEERKKMRERVKDGFQLEDLKREFAGVFYEDEWDSTICEKCGHKTSYPLKGGR